MMRPKPRKYLTLDEVPDPPREVLDALEAFAHRYAAVIKALEKY